LKDFNDFLKFVGNEPFSDEAMNAAKGGIQGVVANEHEKALAGALLIASSVLAQDLLRQYHSWLHKSDE